MHCVQVANKGFQKLPTDPGLDGGWDKKSGSERASERAPSSGKQTLKLSNRIMHAKTPLCSVVQTPEREKGRGQIVSVILPRMGSGRIPIILFLAESEYDGAMRQCLKI